MNWYWFPMAYLDPGTGAIIVQAIVAAFVGTAVFFRNAIRSSLQRVLGRPRKE